MSRDDDQPDPWVRIKRSQMQAMHEQATRDTSTAEQHEREAGFWAGRTAGHDEGRREVLDQLARNRQAEVAAQRQITTGLEEYGRRWARPGEEHGTRKTFGKPREGEWPGLENGGRLPDNSKREADREAG